MKLMKFGYIRVSRNHQKYLRQIDNLNEQCDKVFMEKVTGRKADRPQLKAMYEQLRAGDEVVVWELARFGRSMIDLIRLVLKLKEMGVRFRALKEGLTLDDSAMGKFLFHFFAALAQFESDLISERTNEGLEAARKRGRVGGRPKGLSPAAKKKAAAAATLYCSGEWSVKEIREQLEISNSTLYKYLRHEGVKVGAPFEKLKDGANIPDE